MSVNGASLMTEYSQFLLACRELEGPVELKIKKAEAFSYRPKVSIIMPVWNSQEKWLRAAIESVRGQIYDNWELCMADGGSTMEHVAEVLKGYANVDSRIKVKFLGENKGIAGNSNEALGMATGEYVGFLDHDDELSSDALYEVVSLLDKKPEADFIYSDEDKVNEEGVRYEPHFKPDWAPDDFMGHNYICHFTVIKKPLIDDVGGFRAGYEGSQDYDLFLRVSEKARSIEHIPKILYHWRSVESSASGDLANAKPYAFESAKKALRDHLERMGMKGLIKDGNYPGQYHVCFDIEGAPLVSIIIQAMDTTDPLKRCVESILAKSTYGNYEILIVHSQREEEVPRCLTEVKRDGLVRILPYDQPFNCSAVINYAVSQARGGYLLFLNSDTEVITPGWIEAMLEYAQRKDVGAVGALLYGPDDTVRHAGIIIGIGGAADNVFRGLPITRDGYFCRNSLVQNLSAVSAACLMMKKSVFEEIGGFDDRFSHSYSDIDLCLRLRDRGYLVVYTPFAELYKYEPLNRGHDSTYEKNICFCKNAKLFLDKWHEVIKKGDPYYNPNLTLFKGDFSIKSIPEMFAEELMAGILIKDLEQNIVNLEAHVKGLDTHIKTIEKRTPIGATNSALRNIPEEHRCPAVKILIVSGIGGAPNIYRCLNMKEELYYCGYQQVVCKAIHEVSPEQDARDHNVIFLNRVDESPAIVQLINRCKERGAIVVYSTDDLVTDHAIEEYLGLYKYMSKAELHRFHRGVDETRNLLRICDAVMVSTNYLCTRILPFNGNVYVLENALNEKQVRKAERLMPEFIERKKNREETVIGYFSGWLHDHDSDFATVSGALRKVLQRFNNVRLRIVGFLDIGREFEGLEDRLEHVDFVPFEVLPTIIADVDINIAPLEDNPHKRCKSSIKFLEAGILGVPTVAVNLDPYNEIIAHGEDGLLCSNEDEWFSNLSALVEVPQRRYEIGLKAYAKVRAGHTTAARSWQCNEILRSLIGQTGRHDSRPSHAVEIESPTATLPRERLAKKHLKGEGIEIGALHNPLKVDPGVARVKYVDRKNTEVLQEHYSGDIEAHSIVRPDIVASAEDLSVIRDSEYDFLIANHLIEHCANPVRALTEFHRVTKKHDSIIYIALPNPKGEGSFDKGREVTPVSHFADDYYMREQERRKKDFGHFKEWVSSNWNMAEGEEVLAEANKLYDMDYSIHYHVFHKESFLDLLGFMDKELYVRFEVVEEYADDFEFIFILKPIY
ncbi:MAG: glycosyltransferase [Nitrospirae bacterium]|nr:glycosyltransferase [Nitrospirota bacterium]